MWFFFYHGTQKNNDTEKKALLATAALISAALKGENKGTIHVGKDLAGFLDGVGKDVPTKGYAIAETTGKPASFKATNPSDVALVHGKIDAYVVLEHAGDGTWMNVFPVRAYGP